MMAEEANTQMHHLKQEEEGDDIECSIRIESKRRSRFGVLHGVIRRKIGQY